MVLPTFRFEEGGGGCDPGKRDRALWSSERTGTEEEEEREVVRYMCASLELGGSPVLRSITSIILKRFFCRSITHNARGTDYYYSSTV